MNIRYDSILDTVGRTPVVRLGRIAPPHVEIYVKLEARNPMGSVKDRLALAVIEDAEARGELRPGMTVVEASSGNTGIALAMVCARKGYPLVVVMAESFSVERRRLMRFLGARVVLTPAAQKGSGMMRKAAELAAIHGWLQCRQFDNPVNAAMHERTTGPEILEAFADAPLDWFIAGCGTGGTVTGVSRALRRANSGIRVAVCEPDNAPLLSSGVPQPRDTDGIPSGSHPAFRPHPMQGWTPDFISGLAGTAISERLFDCVVPVGGAQAMHWSRELARREGIFTGITGGATLAGAMQIATQSPPGTRLLCLLPDTGERYLSTPLFADVPVDMTDEELAISRSSPTGRFDVSVPAPGPVPDSHSSITVADAEADDEVGRAVADPAMPVVMFALQWCEFCWTVRRLLTQLQIPYRSIDLDTVAMQRGNLGGRMRTALATRTGVSTIPQIFVGGTLIGGATELIDALEGGHLQQTLAALGVKVDPTSTIDPRSFLPSWLQPRPSLQ